MMYIFTVSLVCLDIYVHALGCTMFLSDYHHVLVCRLMLYVCQLEYNVRS